MTDFAITRRTVLGAVGAASFIPGVAAAREATRNTVETSGGKVRGVAGDGVVVFKGMRYAASTAGTGRFRPPVPTHWSGTFDATAFGDQSPQVRTPLADSGPMSEDCLRVNVWTPRLDGARRPVMLWFHGGGFEAGSASQPLYDGTRLARRGDVVVVSINHRLNVFGHCYLADRLGSDYALSGNVGFLDLVAALRWVRANIASFGGDPGNITIFGQSGGGRKVSLCYASPAADGLFARGIVQSGSHLLVQTPAQAGRLVDLLLGKLGVAGGDARKLLDVPTDMLVEAQRAAIADAGYRFEPVLDGQVFREQPFIPRAPSRTAALPMMLGTTRTELSNQLGSANPKLFNLPEVALPLAVGRFVGADRASEAIDIFRRSRPEASPAELFFTIASARGYGLDQTIMADARVSAGGRGKTWVYKLAWRSPAEGGRRISQHTLDLPLIFDNVAAGERLVGPPTGETTAMANQMADSWIAFAKAGNPNNASIPAWSPYDLEKRATMIFDVPPRAEDDPWREERVFMSGFPTQQGALGRYRSADS